MGNMVPFLTQYTYYNARGVTSDFENFQKIWKAHNRSFRHLLLDLSRNALAATLVHPNSSCFIQSVIEGMIVLKFEINRM